MKLTEKGNLEGHKYLPKDAYQKSDGGSVRSDLEKTRLLHLGNVKKTPHPQFFIARVNSNGKIET